MKMHTLTPKYKLKLVDIVGESRLNPMYMEDENGRTYAKSTIFESIDDLVEYGKKMITERRQRLQSMSAAIDVCALNLDNVESRKK